VKRRPADPPQAAEAWGWRYHHAGIPTTAQRPGERFLPAFGLHVSGFEDSPYGIEFMRFDPDSPLPEAIKTLPHIAFQVPDLDAALQGKTIVYPPAAPSAGVRSAMIEDHGALIELIEFAGPRSLDATR
jgi:hypothetical protein